VVAKIWTQYLPNMKHKCWLLNNYIWYNKSLANDEICSGVVISSVNQNNSSNMQETYYSVINISVLIKVRLEHVLQNIDKSYIWQMYMTTLDMECTLITEVRGDLCYLQLIADKIRCKPEASKMPLVTGVRSRPFFRLMSKCRTEHLKDIQISVNKSFQTYNTVTITIFWCTIRTYRSFTQKWWIINICKKCILTQNCMFNWAPHGITRILILIPEELASADKI